MSVGCVKIVRKSNDTMVLAAVSGTMVMGLKNFGPYKTVTGAQRGQKKAAELFDLEIDSNIEDSKSLKARRTKKMLVSGTNKEYVEASKFCDKLRKITQQESDPQVAYFRLKREFEHSNIKNEVIDSATDGIVYRDVMMDDIKKTVNDGDLMNAKYKMGEVRNFTDLWYHVDGYENYQTLTMDDVNLVIDQIEQEVNA